MISELNYLTLSPPLHYIFMITRRYQEELHKLKDEAQNFVKAHPELEPLMGGAQADPDIARLFEGTALFSALVREKLDDDYPEIIHPLIERIHPQWLRPPLRLPLSHSRQALHCDNLSSYRPEHVLLLCR